MFWITLILVGIAAAAKAVCDTLVHHYSVSVFKNLNQSFWDPTISWINKYIDKNPNKGLIKWGPIDKPVVLTDAWHLFNTIMIFALCGAISINMSYSFIRFCILGLLWNTVFNELYNNDLK